MFFEAFNFNMNYTAFWDTGATTVNNHLEGQPCPVGLTKKPDVLAGNVTERCDSYVDHCGDMPNACGIDNPCISGHIDDDGEAINELPVTCPVGPIPIPNNTVFQEQADEWCENNGDGADAKYGHISNWNTTFVTDMQVSPTPSSPPPSSPLLRHLPHSA